MTTTSGVELGFVEKAESSKELTSPYFPSKVGGKPAWLNLTNLPTPEETACSVCGVPRTFLLQMYAPLPDIATAFHRSFFLFMCLNPSCHQHNNSCGFCVFHCQLPKKNDFYDENSSSEGECSEEESVDKNTHTCNKDDDGLSTNTADPEIAISPPHSTTNESLSGLGVSRQVQDANQHTPLCVVCGNAGLKKCSRCKMVNYCSKQHQTHDWRNGHKLFCSDLMSGKCKPINVTYDPSYGICLPEFVLVTEEEPAVQEKETEVGEEKGEEERMKEYNEFIQSGKYHDHSSGKGGKGRVHKVMEKAESGTKSDKVFKAFRSRVALEPEQVIRYQRGGLPLLVSQDGVPQSIPPCNCGATRQFEFQVMPQLLYYLKLDVVSDASVDWGTVLIYSCSELCKTDSSTCSYMTDFVWKQDISTVTK